MKSLQRSEIYYVFVESTSIASSSGLLSFKVNDLNVELLEDMPIITLFLLFYYGL